MKHLPINKQTELKTLTHLIKDNCSDTQMIILFGSYARGDYNEAKDLLPDRKTGHVSDYDILVVTSKKEVALANYLWDMIKQKCQRYNFSAHPRIITHDIIELNIKLAQGQYFYSDIKKEGIVLFDSKKFQLAEQKELKMEERRKIQQDYFDHWFDRTKGFFAGYEFYLTRNSYPLSAFNLHQTVESAYKTILLVFTNYNPNEHFLEFLGKEVKEFSPQLKNLFLQNTETQKERFKLLEYAYIGGRYDAKYQISKKDLEILAQDVKKLMDITENICKKKINEC